MTLLIILLVIVAALAYTLAPLLQGDQRPISKEVRNRQDAFAEATSRRDSSYEALSDLEFDYAAGKISQDDFARMKRQYQSEAVTALKDIDALDSSASS